MTRRPLALAILALALCVLFLGPGVLDALGRAEAAVAGGSANTVSCSYRARTGLPCMACGGTHALALVARGDLRGALSQNLLGTWTGICAWAMAVASAVALLTSRWRVLRLGLVTVLASAPVALVVNAWVWWVALPAGARP
jgi:hypothetical protein